MAWERNIGNIIEGRSGRIYRSGDIKIQVRTAMQAFEKKGIRGGDRLILPTANPVEFLTGLLALWNLGACAIPVPASLTRSELQSVLKHSRILLPAARGIGRRGQEPVGEEALVLYTSGTTAEPRGAVLTFSALAAKFSVLSRHVETGPWNRVLCLLPLHFGHGLITNVLWPWLSSKDVVIFTGKGLETVSRLGETIDRYEVNFFSSVPAVWRWIFHAGVPRPRKKTLKRAFCGSARLELPVWKSAQSWMNAPLTNVYGMTETASVIAGTEPGEPPEDGLVGRGWGCEFEIRNARDGTGEVWARTASAMQGYLGQPERTRAVFQNGWLRTGDAGYVDARGRLHLKSRLDDVINKAGQKIYPDEVEEVLKESGGVAEACVFGEPHAVFGQEVAAAVVLRRGGLPAVRRWCDHRLSPFKIPRKWYELKEMPTIRGGKISRRKVAEFCRRAEDGH
jgi:oxalate---CoA ligase